MDKVDEVLAGLREEQQRLTQELARVEQAIASLEGSTGARPYTMLNLYEATAHFLSAAGQPKTVREIATALRAGGFKTRSAQFTATVGTMLRRPSARDFGIRLTSDRKRWFVKTSHE
jgi:hypothetical protein